MEMIVSRRHFKVLVCLKVVFRRRYEESDPIPLEVDPDVAESCWKRTKIIILNKNNFFYLFLFCYYYFFYKLVSNKQRLNRNGDAPVK